MNKLTFLFLLILTLIVSCKKEIKTETKIAKEVQKPCLDKWKTIKNYEPQGVIAKKINDTLTQQILYGKVWFEMINQTEIGNGLSKCYIKNYRYNGSLQSEGLVTFSESPVVDDTLEGLWKFYDCNGKIKDEVEFLKGKRLDTK